MLGYKNYLAVPIFNFTQCCVLYWILISKLAMYSVVRGYVTGIYSVAPIIGMHVHVGILV